MEKESMMSLGTSYKHEARSTGTTRTKLEMMV